VTFRDELATIRGDHSDLPLGFCDSLMAWGTSSTWQFGQQEDIRGSPCRRDFIPIRIGLYLQEFTLGVQEVDYSIRQLHEELDKFLYYDGALLIDCVQRASSTYTWLDNEWSKACFTVIRMAWDLGIEGLLHDQTVQR